MNKSEKIFKDYEKLAKSCVELTDTGMNLKEYRFDSIEIASDGIRVVYYDKTGCYSQLDSGYCTMVVLPFSVIDKELLNE